MNAFSAYAQDFELHPAGGAAHEHLAPLFGRLGRVDFQLRVEDPGVNQGQATSDFDAALERVLLATGGGSVGLTLPPAIPQQLDFAFRFGGRTVAVEIEKANREKILRDLLKCHMYLHAGADFALIVLPRNYAHTHGIWDLFGFGVQRYDECLHYGFGVPERLGRILLLGFTQYDGRTDEAFSTDTRRRMRSQAAKAGPGFELTGRR